MQFSYIQPRFKKIINVTDIQTIHYFECDETFDFKGERHDSWEMVYVNSGKVEIQREEEVLVLEQGGIIFHEPNEFHAIKSYQSSPDFFVMSFVCKSAAMKCFQRYTSVLSAERRSVVSSIIAEAEKTYQTSKIAKKKKEKIIGGEQMVKSYLEQLLITLIREISTNDNNTAMFPSKESMENHLVIEIKNFLNTKLTDKLDTVEVCTKFGYSRAYLSRLFKTQCGTSLMRYYIEQKIELAKKMIREKKYNISQISNILCFDNPQYFSRVFKRVTGVKPSEYMHSLK